jgi:hypothetical protein
MSSNHIKLSTSYSGCLCGITCRDYDVGTPYHNTRNAFVHNIGTSIEYIIIRTHYIYEGLVIHSYYYIYNIHHYRIIYIPTNCDRLKNIISAHR